MDTVPVTLESLRENGGVRSVTRVVLPPGAKAILHRHDEYAETFYVVEGELTVFAGSANQLVCSGEYSDTIAIKESHRYENKSGADVTVDIILEPGHAGAEVANFIVAGMKKDNRLAQLSKSRGYNLTNLAFFEITNTIPVGVAALIFGALRLWYGRKEVERAKSNLFQRYRGLVVRERSRSPFGRVINLDRVGV